MTTTLLQKSMNIIESRLNKVELKKYDKFWDCRKAEFTFGNDRVVKVYKLIPNKATNKSKAKVHYTISFLGIHNTNNHMTLDEVAKKVYEMGLENLDPFKDGVNTKKLRDLGFQQIEELQEPNIKDIGWYLEDGFYQYKFEVDEYTTYYGPEYDTGNMYYYGSRYCDTFRREYLCVRHSENENWTRALYRDIKVGSRCISNYVGD